MSNTAQNYFLDITGEVCPMTFVKTRLLIEKMRSGETAEILLPSGEPVDNVPASVAELGHRVVSLDPVDGDRRTFRLVIRIR